MVSRRLRELEPFLDLDHLVQAALPRAIGHHPAGVFIDDLHLVRRQSCSAGRAGTGAAPTGPVRRVPRAPAQCPTVPAARGRTRRPRRARRRSVRCCAPGAAAGSAPANRGWRPAPAPARRVHARCGSSTSLEMISGVRASSISTLSASSTMAKYRPRSSAGDRAGLRAPASQSSSTARRHRRSPRFWVMRSRR
jgi:hypothetical protein